MPKKLERPSPPPPKEPPPWPLVYMIVVGLLLASTLRPTGAARVDPSLAVPVNFQGVWVTNDERYAGRSLDISQNLVFLEVGVVGGARGGRVTEMETWWEGLTEVVRIEYRTPDGPDALELRLSETGYMTLKNLPQLIWRKSTATGGVAQAGA